MKRFLLCLALIAALPGMSKSGLVYAAGGSKMAAAAETANPADFVGSEVCATCHADQAKKFETNPHSKLALTHGGTGATCESCHGPGKAHVESGGDVTKIQQLSKMTSKEIDTTCLGCHAGTHPNFERSPHAKAAVGCTSCHSIHSPGAEVALLKVDQPKLCFTCHADARPAFDMPFHHKVNEGLLKCSDCHDPHGTFQNNNLKSTADQNAICTKCHTETRGPFVFEHAAVKAEGCVGCHTPHGSQNARLLNAPYINQLCNQCHSPVSGSTVHGMNAGSADVTPCISCHTMIHGSNVNPAFLR
ncbi:MAG: DmsE family decaheme c-type cytochrome [Acidobacteriaceae bacterium]|jgi:DmsE family decaheme c-type cytochrome